MENAAAWLLLAQGGDGGMGGALGMMPMFIILFALFYLLMIRPEKQRQKAHQEMLGALKQNDRVVTVGGVYGVVTNVRREADEVTVRIDDATNTKMRVTFSAIARVLVEGANDGKEKTS